MNFIHPLRKITGVISIGAKMSKRKLHLSASAIGAFLACPMRFKGAYIDGVRKSVQTESQRRGTNWHELLEIVGLPLEAVCRFCAHMMHPDADCPVCQGTGYLVGDSMDAAHRMLASSYEHVPAGVAVEDWQTERAKLFYSLSAYKWWWGIGEQEQDYKVIATEVPFDMPIINPGTGNPCRDVVLVGKIDKVVQFSDGSFGQMEHKSTARPIGDDCEYWKHLRMDVQTTLYPYAMLRMQKEGKLEHLDIMPDSPIATKVLYDAWHTPAIKMKKLSFADTKKFVRECEYMGEKFGITGASIETTFKTLTSGKQSKVSKDTVLYGKDVRVDGHPVKTIKGAKEGDVNFMETEGMYGTRLFTDITGNPERFYNRREINRSVDEMAIFERKMYSIYKAVLMMRRTDGWWTDGTQCEVKFRCQYTPYCWHGEELSPDNLLEGFECIFRKDDENGDA